MITWNKFSTSFNRFLDVPSVDPDDSRRRKLLNIILAFVFGLTLFVIAITTVDGLISGFAADTPSIYIVSFVLVFGTALLFLINRYVRGGIAGVIFLVFLVVVFGFSDTPEQLANGRSLFIFTIPIIMASMLLRPSLSFVFAALTTAELYVLADLSETTVRVNPISIAVFFMVAAISWLSSRTLEQALKDLRIINTELDQRVADRTHELSESLNREAAQASQREAILNSIADGVVVFDNDGRAIVANPSLTSLTGKSHEAILGQNLPELLKISEISEVEKNLISEMFTHSRSAPTFRINWGNKTLSVNASEVHSQGNKESIGTVAVFRDVTREVELDRMKDAFLAVVSHELRTPLNAILGFAEMIKETVYGPVSESQVRASSRIMENTSRLLSIVSELLDQAQIQSGRMKIAMEPCEPAELLKSLQDTMEKVEKDKKIAIYTELDPSMPSTLMGDSKRLQQILINLTNNGIKFSDSGDEVRVSIRKQDENNWQIQVSDTGQGIPEDALDYIFDTFRQVESSATRKHGGVGLGLAIVKQLVELMNGKIVVESRVNAGSTFTVTLPLITN